jgi:hypothetical protein
MAQHDFACNDTWMRKSIALLSIGLSVTVPMGLSSCSSKKKLADKIIERQTGVKVKEDGTVEVQTSDGSLTMGKAEKPKDFPEGVPLPKGTVDQSFATSAGGQKTWMVSTQVDDITKQIDELKASYKSKGYKIDAETTQNSNGKTTSMFIASKGKVTAIVAGEAEESKPPTVVVTVGEKDS